ncbi:MAG TPA: hypothetical protein VMB20_09530 [Candidatus Acidoferrum sp.]|nr:hypothetical protein [Candidatus Acidoferrum sp.]
MNKRALVAVVIAAVLVQIFGVQDAPARGGRGGGGARMGGGGRAMSRPAAPAQRPSTPVQRPSNGYNFNNDIGRPPSASQLPSGPGVGNRPGGGVGNGGGNRPGNGGGIGNRPPVAPIAPPLPAWGWNGGVIWYPAYGYWGGGFWGPYGYGYYPGYYGSYTYVETHEEVKSYEVAQDSPGSKVLAAYGLTQTQCGPEGLVVIFGPENSVICAQANATVAAGEYQLDTTNLTIVSLAAS